MTAPVFCDPLHNPCETDYVSDADRLREMADRFRAVSEREGWLMKLAADAKIKHRAAVRHHRYYGYHKRALHLWAKKSGEYEKPLYRGLMRERKRCAANWLMYCLNDLRIPGEVS